MFSHLPKPTLDPILSLSVAYRGDPRTDKVDLGIGVYKNDQGETPIMKAVSMAQDIVVDTQKTKAYVGLAGCEEFNQSMVDLLLKGTSAMDRVAAIQTPGASGALRMLGDLMKVSQPDTTVWISNPSYVNHKPVMEAAGLKVRYYNYFSPETKQVDTARMLDDLSKAGPSDVVLLHGCCHNPTGADIDFEAWQEITKLSQKNGFLPFVDIAYQGFGDGLEEDAKGLQHMANNVEEMLITTSCSKNFGLYNERVGALTILCETAEQAETAFTQIKRCIRTNYSNPPSHGSAVVAEILNDPELFALWESEVKAMRTRIHEMRSLFVNTLRIKGVSQDFSFISQQQGMFSFSGLTPDQVAQLRKEFGIYIVGSGRISVAGMTHDNMEPLCDAIANILKG